LAANRTRSADIHTWARKFFDGWREQLKWQRLKPYEKFAEMIERHWDGIAAYCKPENKVALGFVEGLNNMIRVIQRRAYGLHDEEYAPMRTEMSFRSDGYSSDS
jgi:transposase